LLIGESAVALRGTKRLRGYRLKSSNEMKMGAMTTDPVVIAPA
jgi:hypothetical protein